MSEDKINALKKLIDDAKAWTPEPRPPFEGKFEGNPHLARLIDALSCTDALNYLDVVSVTPDVILGRVTKENAMTFHEGASGNDRAGDLWTFINGVWGYQSCLGTISDIYEYGDRRVPSMSDSDSPWYWDVVVTA